MKVITITINKLTFVPFPDLQNHVKIQNISTNYLQFFINILHIIIPHIHIFPQKLYHKHLIPHNKKEPA